MGNLRDTSRELRDLGFSGTDQFMQGGHQIINSNLAFSGGRRKPALWAADDKKIQELLLRVFPKLKTDERQRKMAGRWTRAIHLHHRSGMSYGDVAAEMGSTVSAIRSLFQHIRRSVNGFACNRAGKKRKRATFQTSLGAPNEQGS